MSGSPSLARVEWPNQNTLRRYPLAVFAGGVDSTGRLTLPSSTFVDMRIGVPFDTQLHFAGFYISELVFNTNMFVVAVSHKDSNVVLARCVGSVSAAENISHVINGTDLLTGTRGHLVTGDLQPLTRLTPGSYLFDFAQTALDPGVIYIQPKAIRSIAIDSGGSFSSELYGRVKLRSAEGTQFRVTSEDGVQTIIWDVVGNDGFRKDCECDNSTSNPVLTVGGLPPDSTGNVNLFGSRCLEISAQTAGVKFDNSCSEPCCDCQEDSGIESRLDLLRQQYITMDVRLAELEGRLAMSPNIDGSDGGCDSIDCQPFTPNSGSPLVLDYIPPPGDE